MGTSNYSDEFKQDAVHQIRRRTYPTRDAARQDVFEYIELSTTRSANTRTTACCRPLISRSGSRN